ncbi:MAG: sulfatase [Deltaproteobacteria bacterium]|nr:sulfatase [Deltaproteobacteria bacterium]
MAKKDDPEAKVKELEAQIKKNVIVVMFDSLQFNYLGCYGNPWIRTPNMDRLAREGVLFENNYIDSLPTVPCRRSMHTGKFSLHYRGWSPLELEDTTIADLCWGRPIDTALVFDCPMYRLPKFGYTRGFDKVSFLHGHEGDQNFYLDDPLYHRDPMNFIEEHVMEAATRQLGKNTVNVFIKELEAYLRHRQYWRTEEDQNVVKVMKRAVKYLEEIDRNKQFFLWIDSFDPHEPWDPPSVYDADLKCPYDPDYKGKDMFLPVDGVVNGVYTEPELNHIRMLYAEKVSMCDRWLGYLMDKVKELGLEQNTLFLMVSDHGEPMGNGEHGHGIMRKCRPWPYEELSHAPMIARGPGLPSGKRVKAFTQSQDVGATVVDWLGIGVRPEMTGKSLIPLMKGEVEKVRDFIITGYHKFSAAIYTEDFSYFHWRKPTDKANGVGVEFFTENMAKALKSVGALERGKDVDAVVARLQNESISSEEAEYKQAATLDGEDMWTCTPGSVADVPEKDELYDHQADPFQLNDIAEKNPKKARELFDTLRDFMADISVQ